MTSVQHPNTLDDGAQQLARQLAAVRGRSRLVAHEVRRIRAELVDVIMRIDAHISSKRGLP